MSGRGCRYSQVYLALSRASCQEAFTVALLLCLLLIGILVFIYMLVVKPDGTLTVTYSRPA